MENNLQQLPLEFTPRVVFNPDDLVITGSNSAAFELIEQWPHWNSPIAMIIGPSGSGKTHFATVWQEKAKAFRAQNLHDPELIKESHNGRAILYENIDSHKIDETALFHIFNIIKQAHIEKQKASLLLTARSLPSSWKLSLKDLISRLRSVTLASITPPDDMLLKAVLLKQFSDRQILVEPDIIDYIVSRMERSLSMAALLVHNADRLALAQKRKITKPLISEVLNAF